MSEEHIDESDGAGAGESLNLKALARDHAGLLIASGVAAGALLAIALTPSSTRKRLAERAMTAAAAAGEASKKMGRQSVEKLEGLGETISGNAEVVRERAVKVAGDAKGTGLELLRAGLAIIAALRR